MPVQATLAEEITGLHDTDDTFLTLLRDDGDLDLAGPNIKYRVGIVSLPVDRLSPRIGLDGPSAFDRCEKRLGVELIHCHLFESSPFSSWSLCEYQILESILLRINFKNRTWAAAIDRSSLAANVRFWLKADIRLTP